MKRCLFIVIAVAMVVTFVPGIMHAQKEGQPTVFTNAKPMTFGYNTKTYYLVQKTNIENTVNAIPEDKFFALPPGCTAETCRGEQASIGAEIAHMIDAQDRMCTIMLTGKETRGPFGGTEVMKEAMPTKADMVAAMKKSFDLMDQLVNNFDDAKVTAMVNSQHALQPYGSTLFNTISHDREVYGRVLSYMAAMGIKGPREINASDPANKQDLYFCGGQSSKDVSICTTSKN